MEKKGEKIQQAQKRKAYENGDILPLQLLNQVRMMAHQRGWVKKPKKARCEVNDIKNQQTQIGDDVYVPVPGQEVGSGARPSWKDPHPLSRLMRVVVRERGWSSVLDVAAMANRWEEVIGPNIAQHSHVEEFNDSGKLVIRAHSVGWETQLQALIMHIDRRLAEILGEGVVKEIVIKGPHQRSWKHGKYSVPGRGPRDTYD